MDFDALISRIKNIITQPTQEWEKISKEKKNLREIILKYAIPLIALGTFSEFIQNAFFIAGHSILLGVFSGTVYFISMLAGIYISAIIMNELAPSFDSEKNIISAYKLVIYSFTASFLAYIIANLHYGFSIIGLFGLYSIYLLWLGITPLMKIPESKKAGYFLLSVVIVILVFIIINRVLYLIVISPFLGTFM